MSQSAKIFEIQGEQLSAVSFVQDYIEFHFDEKIVRSLTHPSLTISGQTFKFPSIGSRDGLCLLIGRTIETVNIVDLEGIELKFVEGGELIIPLANSEREGPEAAHYVPGMNLPIEVW